MSPLLSFSHRRKPTSQRFTLSPPYAWHKEKRAISRSVRSRNIFLFSPSLAGFEGLLKLEMWTRTFDVAYRASEMTHELQRWGVTPRMLPRLPWLQWPQFILIMTCFGAAADVRCQSNGTSLNCGPTNTVPEPCKFLSQRTITLLFWVIQLCINCLSAPFMSNTRLSIREDIQFCRNVVPKIVPIPSPYQ